MGAKTVSGSGFDIGAYEYGASLIFADDFESGHAGAWS